MAFFIYKLFSLVAARSKLLTSYFMFAEDYIQRWLFLSSRGFSRASLLVFLFSTLNILASLYGTLLWTLDAPGYFFREINATAADYATFRNGDVPYIIHLDLKSDNLENTTKSLQRFFSADLFDPGLNYTLTAGVDLGSPETVAPTQLDDIGARIWLDHDGFSVSCDESAMLPAGTANIDQWPECVYSRNGQISWNCTFDNFFTNTILARITGSPQIHWDDASDLANDYRYIDPSHADNLWASSGTAGGASAAMMQVFTVTKGNRRHTFVESTYKITMFTSPSALFARDQVDDLVRRSFSSNKTEQQNPKIDKIVNGMMNAQSQNMSHYSGSNNVLGENRTVVQAAWGYFTVAYEGENLASQISVTGTNITLLRSETLPSKVEPLAPCNEAAFQNLAFGGKVSHTDCAGTSFNSTPNHFFGQVDTSAVLLLTGTGKRRSNISAESFDDKVNSWIDAEYDRLQSLLIARGYIAGVDPTLVTVEVKKLVTAVSGLQLFLGALAAVLAAAAWLGLLAFADASWSKSFLSNLVSSTDISSGRGGKRRSIGYMYEPPEIGLVARGSGGRRLVTLDERAVVVERAVMDEKLQTGLGDNRGFETNVREVEEEELTGRYGLLSHSVERRS